MTCLGDLAICIQAVCFLRPTRENIARLRQELRDPRYGDYYLCEHPALDSPPWPHALCIANQFRGVHVAKRQKGVALPAFRGVTLDLFLKFPHSLVMN